MCHWMLIYFWDQSFCYGYNVNNPLSAKHDYDRF